MFVVLVVMEYMFIVLVNDMLGNVDSDFIIIIVSLVNIVLVVDIFVFEWEGFEENYFFGGVEVIFDGLVSIDEDVSDLSDVISEYSWI